MRWPQVTEISVQFLLCDRAQKGQTEMLGSQQIVAELSHLVNRHAINLINDLVHGEKPMKVDLVLCQSCHPVVRVFEGKQKIRPQLLS